MSSSTGTTRSVRCFALCAAGMCSTNPWFSWSVSAFESPLTTRLRFLTPYGSTLPSTISSDQFHPVRRRGSTGVSMENRGASEPADDRDSVPCDTILFRAQLPKEPPRRHQKTKKKENTQDSRPLPSDYYSLVYEYLQKHGDSTTILTTHSGELDEAPSTVDFRLRPPQQHGQLFVAPCLLSGYSLLWQNGQVPTAQI